MNSSAGEDRRMGAPALSVDELDAVFLAITDPVVIYDRSGQPVKMNPTASAALGLDIVPAGSELPDRLRISQRLAIRYHDGRPVAFADLPSSRALAGESVVDSPYLFQDARGEELSVVVSAAPIQRDGQVNGAVVVWHDVTRQQVSVAALRESEARLSILAEATFEGILVHEAGTILEVNQQLAAMIGYEPQEMIGKTIWELIVPEDIAPTRRAITNHDVQVREVTGVRRDGTRFLVEVQARDSVYRGHRVRVVAVRDITDRKRREAADHFLAAAGNVLASSLDYAGTLENVGRVAVPQLADICLIDLLEENQVQRTALVGGREDGPALAERLSGIFPIDDAQVQPLATVLRTGQPVLISDVAAAGGAGANGLPAGLPSEPAPVSAMTVPLLSGGATIGGLTLIGIRPDRRYDSLDVALAEELGRHAALALENARLYRQARYEQARWEATVEHMLDPVTVCDAQGRAIYMNAAYSQLVGYRIEHGLSLADTARHYQLYRSDGTLCAPEALPLQRAALAGEEVRDFELIQRTDSGSEIYSVWSASPLHDADGRVIGAVAVGRDLTEQRRAAAELERLLQQVQAYASELQGANAQLHAQATELERARDELEARVQERTRELAAVVRALAESEGRFRTMFERAGIGIALIDAQGRTIQTNPALQTMLGYTDDELHAMSYTEYTHPDDLAYDAENLQALMLRQRDVYQMEKRYVRKDGQIRWGSLTVSALPGQTGEPLFAIRMVEDITERKRTERALAQYTERLRLLHEIDTAILAAQSPAEIAASATQHVSRLIPSTRAAVLSFDWENQEARILAVQTGGDTALTEGRNLPIETLRPLEPLHEGDADVVEDLAARPQPGPVEQQLVAEGVRAYVALPLLAGHELIGVLELGLSKPGRLPAEAMDVARQVADSLAVAIHNARLFEQVEFSRHQLQSLSRRLVEVQENERRAIARELHDEAGQALTSLMLGLGLLQREAECSPAISARVDDLKRITDNVLEGLHELAINLRPTSLDKLGLVPALRQYLEVFKTQSGIDARFVAVGLSEARLSPEVETTLYRVVQEAVTNVARHARATRVGVILERHEERALAIIEDNGIGFDVDIASQSGRLGLFGMRERAEMLGGTLTIESAPGAGTTIYAEVPYIREN